MSEIFEDRIVWNRFRHEYEKKKVRRKQTDDDRIVILREYFETGVPASRIIEKYQLSSRAILFGWMDKYLNEESELAGNTQRQEGQTSTEEELRQENERLKKALALEKLRSEAYSTMIDVAEKTINIPIRKKRGTKHMSGN